MARKSRDEGGGGQEWMNTYSDLVTLLMTFFVLLFSMSSVNAEKWEMLVNALSPKENANSSQVVVNNPGTTGDSPLENQGGGDTMVPGDPSEIEDFTDLFAVLQQYVKEKGMEQSIEVSKNGDNVVYIRFKNNIFFMPDKSDLKKEATEILDYVGECLNAVEDQIRIISINGHTADVGNEQYAVSDWMLSSARAGQVADYLDMKMDIDPTKLRPMGYGKNYPVADNSTDEGRQQNRRVDMTIVKEDGSTADQHLVDLFDPAQFGNGLDLFTPSATLGTENLPADSSPESANEAGASMTSEGETPPADTPPAPASGTE